jgi:kynurenine formamidase
VVAYRTPRGLIAEGIPGFEEGGVSFNTSMITISDHAGTQLDGLCHATFGDDHHWYNGYTSREWGRDFGPERAGAHNIPPIIAPGLLIDVAGHQGVDELPAGHPISSRELQAALAAQGTAIEPGTVVLVRTGALRHWDGVGHDHDRLRGPDTAGLTLESARWLVEETGAIIVATDTSAVECVPPADGDCAAPVHKYLLVDQGVHMGELHFLEDLAAEQVYSFCYLALAPKVRASTAGFAMRPIALT